jgi:hypothetical protein
MATSVCFMLLTLGLATLVWGNYSDLWSANTMHGHVQGPSRRPFKSVLVMQPAQNRRRRDSMANRKIVTTKLLGHPFRRWIRNAWPEAGMWSATIVVSHPILKDSAKMSFTARDHPIQALSANGADHAFAMSVRLRCPHGRLENRQTHGHQSGIDALGIDAVAVVNDPSMGPIA